MNHKRKVASTMLLWGISMLLIFSANAHAIVWYNGSPTIKIEIPDMHESLDHAQIDGAGHFLKAYSDILLILQKIEIADSNGADFVELQGLLEETISNLKTTREVYSILKEEMELMTPDPGMLMELAFFNYDAYCWEHRLNPFIFRKVKSFLMRGDVEGLYGDALIDIEEMIDIASRMKKRVAAGQFPELKDLWHLDEVCAQTLRTGQYTARVFIEIKNKKE